MALRRPGWGAVTLACVAMAAIGYQTVVGQTSQIASTEWPTYGHDSGGMRFSPLKQITPANVSRLTVAWTYHMKPAADPAAPAPPAEPDDSAPAGRGAGGRGGGRGGRGGGNGFAMSETTPLVAADRLQEHHHLGFSESKR